MMCRYDLGYVKATSILENTTLQPADYSVISAVELRPEASRQIRKMKEEIIHCVYKYRTGKIVKTRSQGIHKDTEKPMLPRSIIVPLARESQALRLQVQKIVLKFQRHIISINWPGGLSNSGDEPNLSPGGLLTRSHSEYVEGTSLIDMTKEDLVAERIAIESYREVMNYLGNQDSTSRRMLEKILAVEEEHADDLVSLLEGIDS